MYRRLIEVSDSVWFATWVKKGTIKGQLKEIMTKFVKAGKHSFMMKAKFN